MGPALDYPALHCGSVCVCMCVIGMELQCLAKGAPSAFTLPRSTSQRVLGCVSRAINFSGVSGMTFEGISVLRLGGVCPHGWCLCDPLRRHCLVCTEAGIGGGSGVSKHCHFVHPSHLGPVCESAPSFPPPHPQKHELDWPLLTLSVFVLLSNSDSCLTARCVNPPPFKFPQTYAAAQIVFILANLCISTTLG